MGLRPHCDPFIGRLSILFLLSVGCLNLGRDHNNLSLNYPVPRKFLGIVGQVPSDSKSSQLHVDIFRFCFIHLRYILLIPLKWSVILLKSPTSTIYFSNSTGSSVSNRQFFPDIDPGQQLHALLGVHQNQNGLGQQLQVGTSSKAPISHMVRW